MIQIEDKDNKCCAIYCILNLENGKMYFGQTVNYKNRSEAHYYSFKSKTHSNRFLQYSYNRKDKFIIFPIEFCSEDQLNDREIYWITLYNTTNRFLGYNLQEGGKAIKKELLIWTDERKQKQSDYIKNNPIPNRMLKMPEDIKKKMSDIRNKYYETNNAPACIEVEIFNLNSDICLGKFKSLRELAKQMNLSEKTIYNRVVRTGKDWTELVFSKLGYKIIKTKN